jgi:hypothetical protein
VDTFWLHEYRRSVDSAHNNIDILRAIHVCCKYFKSDSNFICSLKDLPFVNKKKTKNNLYVCLSLFFDKIKVQHSITGSLHLHTDK